MHQNDEKNVSFSAPPALTAGGELVAPSYEKNIYGLDAGSGQQKWINQDATNRFYAGPLVLDGSTFTANIDHFVYALQASGLAKWEFETADALWSTPISDGKAIYISGMDHFIYAFDPDTGRLIWKTEDLGGSMPGSPALGTDGQLYAGNFASKLVAVDSTSGKTIWSTPVDSWIYSNPVLLDQVLYFGTLDGTLYAVEASGGKILWQVPTDTANIRAEGYLC